MDTLTTAVAVTQLTEWGKFIYLVIGTTDFSFFGALMLFALIGQTIRFTQDVTKRDVNSTATPVPFSWQFLFLDNWKRIVNTVLMIFVFLRFYPLLIGLLPDAVQPYFNSLSTASPMLIGLVVGYGIDYLSGYLKDKFAALQINREAVVEKINSKMEDPTAGKP